MNVVAKPTIVGYQKSYPLAAKGLQAWLTIASKAKWRTPDDVKQVDPKASIVGDGRVVFDKYVIVNSNSLEGEHRDLVEICIRAGVWV